MKLFAPEEYWNLNPEAKAEISNGCGPAAGLGFIVPDTVYGLSISPCCDIHDYMYHVGTREVDRILADRVFLNNMTRLVRAKSKYQWLANLRLRRVSVYYEAVRKFGGPAFWDSKNSSTEFKDA